MLCAVHNKENVDPIGEISKTSGKQERLTTSLLHVSTPDDDTTLSARGVMTTTFKDKNN